MNCSLCLGERHIWGKIAHKDIGEGGHPWLQSSNNWVYSLLVFGWSQYNVYGNMMKNIVWNCVDKCIETSLVPKHATSGTCADDIYYSLVRVGRNTKLHIMTQVFFPKDFINFTINQSVKQLHNLIATNKYVECILCMIHYNLLKPYFMANNIARQHL